MHRARWEICKVQPDAEKEFDRTIDYIVNTIKALKDLRNAENTFLNEGGVVAQVHDPSPLPFLPFPPTPLPYLPSSPLQAIEMTLPDCSDDSEQVRRAPLGVMLNLGPFNYPFNETYTTLIPAILMGNSVVMKLPNVGCLAHIPTMEVFAECFPKGVVNFISGAGRETMPPIMETGKVDIFAFIGSSKAADALIKNCPNPHKVCDLMPLAPRRGFSDPPPSCPSFSVSPPSVPSSSGLDPLHRLMTDTTLAFPQKVRFCLALDAKNLAVVLPDADLDNAVNECVLGSLSYNGQRCTALKLLLVHNDILMEFAKKFTARVESLKAGLPWTKGTDITPLPEPGLRLTLPHAALFMHAPVCTTPPGGNVGCKTWALGLKLTAPRTTGKPAYLEELRNDAKSKGATVVSPKGNSETGWGHTMVFPSVIYPVTSDMRVWNEEQFGPLVPIGGFSNISEVVDYVKTSPFGQQASIFTKSDVSTLGPLVDVMANCVARINVNSQCQRSPDTFPFTGESPYTHTHVHMRAQRY